MKFRNPFFVYDYDDTLVKSGNSCQIAINQPNGLIKTIFPDQLPGYKLKLGETIDYSSFESNYSDPGSVIIIQQIWDKFVEHIQAHGEPRVAILTARINPTPVETFLNFKGIAGVAVNAVGSTRVDVNTTKINAINKKSFFRKYIEQNPLCDYIEFYDDNKLNIERAKELRHEYPHIKICTRRIKHVK